MKKKDLKGLSPVKKSPTIYISRFFFKDNEDIT